MSKEMADIKYVKIKLASPEKVVNEWSHGEVQTHETINYRTLKPELGGLFCERIFGPYKDYECHCGTYKKSTYKGKRCEKCGVDIISSKVRRQRKGHITLEEPVVSPLFKKYIINLLDCKQRDINALINYNAFIVVESNNEKVPAGTIFEEEAKVKSIENLTYQKGTPGLYAYLKNYDLDKEIKKSKQDLNNTRKEISKQIEKKNNTERYDGKISKINEKLEFLINFKNSGNKPEWLVMKVLPVIPPDLRPLVQIGSGRFVVSGLNDLYRKVIMRNNRLKEMKKIGAASILIYDSCVSLQRAIEELVDNSKNNESLNSANRNQKIQKSLIEMLKGKQGRFRQNLLGKRVDFSGRSVIVVGPNLKLDECGIPKLMALELFKPFVIGGLIKSGKAYNMKAAKNKLEQRDEDVWEILEKVIKDHKVLLNRAPTLHRLGIQAFKPKLVEGKAIRLSPLVCTAYNADFDGDQMAVHLPLSSKAQEEATKLMLASNNILNPKDGSPIVEPSQDMILGNYYITMEEKPQQIHIFKDPKEALMALELKKITLHELIYIKADKIDNAQIIDDNLANKLLLTTIGKYIFNNILPIDMPFVTEPTIANIDQLPKKYLVTLGSNLQEIIDQHEVNMPFKKSYLSSLISKVFEVYNIAITSKMLDDLKALGYKYSALSGISISFSDVPTVEKQDILDESQAEVDKWNQLYEEGMITEEEKYQKVTQEIWIDAREAITEKLMAELDHKNNIHMMSDSGARGNRSNFTQLGAMRGLMAAPNGKIIELPVKSSFKEGLTVLEYFISSHGARKGLADTALKTADSGYLTRRLVDVAQDLVVSTHDCHTYEYETITAIKEGTETIVELKDRILGRTIQEDLTDNSGNIIAHKDDLLTDEQDKAIIIAGIEEIKIRNISTCKSEQGICQKCYGRDLATNNIVQIGEAIGTIAAQSIGEPGTQLTMRTFHTGGVAGNDITQGLPRVVELFEARTPKGKAVIATESGRLEIIEKTAEIELLIKDGDTILVQENIPHGIKIKFNSGDEVKRGDLLTEGSIHPKELAIYKGISAVKNYILKEIQKVYRLQGVGINDKHIEIIVYQMLKYSMIIDAKDTELIPGELIRYHHLLEANKKVKEGGDYAIVRPVVMGIKEASLKTDSFLSAASFQETAKIIANASVRGKIDHLTGLKENVILGKMIPAGTGKDPHYKGIGLDDVKKPNVEADLTEVEKDLSNKGIQANEK
ncbi:MAG: DNA-directed RNA polymerase subunit beta' [Mycoplasmatales bacterium]